uniref:Uncharacterized protein n=1 Tax=Timema bartmani TaxID=61472 RepID=A0A7R9I4R5_9NEOP|nr:unnamed protein product [Timema bartmani]
MIQCLLACVYRRLGGMTLTGMAVREELRDSLLELYRDSEYKQSRVEAIIDHCGPQGEELRDRNCTETELYRDSEYKQSRVEAIIDHCGPQVALQPDVCCMAKKLFDCIKENVY